jgi:hypothetical protein
MSTAAAPERFSEKKSNAAPLAPLPSTAAAGGSGRQGSTSGSSLLRVISGNGTSNHDPQEMGLSGSHSPMHLTTSQGTQLGRPLIGASERYLEEGAGGGVDRSEGGGEEIMIPVSFDTSHV